MAFDALERDAHPHREEQEHEQDDDARGDAQHQLVVLVRERHRQGRPGDPRRSFGELLAAQIGDFSVDLAERAAVQVPADHRDVAAHRAEHRRVAADHRQIAVDHLVGADGDVLEQDVRPAALVVGAGGGQREGEERHDDREERSATLHRDASERDSRAASRGRTTVYTRAIASASAASNTRTPIVIAVSELKP